MTKPRKKRTAESGFDAAALDALLGERRTLARRPPPAARR
jgi:hypothetical protein